MQTTVGYERDHNLNYGIAINKQMEAIDKFIIEFGTGQFDARRIVALRVALMAFHGKIMAGMWNKVYEEDFTKRWNRFITDYKIEDLTRMDGSEQKKIFQALVELGDIYAFQEEQLKRLGLTGKREVAVINAPRPGKLMDDYVLADGDLDYKSEAPTNGSNE